jgi:hypothetical protein
MAVGDPARTISTVERLSGLLFRDALQHLPAFSDPCGSIWAYPSVHDKTFSSHLAAMSWETGYGTARLRDEMDHMVPRVAI